MRVIVVGAGIGGLTTAIALRQHGIDVTIVEQASALGEIGAGIQISSNGVAVLKALGVEERVAEVAVLPQVFEYIELETGEVLFWSPLGAEAEQFYGHRFYHVHRADLLDVLAEALPADVFRMGSRCVRIEQDPSAVRIELGTGEVLTADAVIGADGIHSVIREQLVGSGNPQFTGILGWRALIPRELLTDQDLPHSVFIWTGPGRACAGYWVRNGSLFNFLGLVPATEVHRESWTTSQDVADLRSSFVGCEPRIQAMLDVIDEAFITGLFYRDPLESWADGRIALLGDACHAMPPYLAQGACQAMEDAWVLARCLTRNGDDAIRGLDEYDRRRRPRATKVQAMSRDAAKSLHETDPVEIRARNGRWKGISAIDPMRETVWGWLYHYNAVKEAEAPLEQVLGLAPAYEGKRMRRPEAQRAFDLWKGVFKPEDIARGFTGMRSAYDRFLLNAFPVADDVTVTEAGDDAVAGLWVEPPGATGDTVVLHLHGGGLVMGSARSSVELAGRLAGAVGGRCFTVDYRLAPEAPFPAALDDALGAFRWLRSQGVPADRIVVSGESAGGGLAVATVLALKDAGDPLPAGVIAISPFADQTVSDPSIRELAGQDPLVDRDRLVLFAGAYFQDRDPRDPLVSPVFGDFGGFPPLLVQAARGEVLCSDAVRLAEQARAAGAEVELELFDDTVHVFPTFPFLPETTAALEQIATFARRHVGTASY